MIEFMVMTANTNGKPQPLGRHTFTILPQVGEYVTLNDENDTGQAYRIKTIIHAPDNASTAGDLIVEYVGTDVEFRKNL